MFMTSPCAFYDDSPFRMCHLARWWLRHSLWPARYLRCLTFAGTGQRIRSREAGISFDSKYWLSAKKDRETWILKILFPLFSISPSKISDGTQSFTAVPNTNRGTLQKITNYKLQCRNKRKHNATLTFYIDIPFARLEF